MDTNSACLVSACELCVFFNARPMRQKHTKLCVRRRCLGAGTSEIAARRRGGGGCERPLRSFFQPFDLIPNALLRSALPPSVLLRGLGALPCSGCELFSDCALFMGYTWRRPYMVPSRTLSSDCLIPAFAAVSSPHCMQGGFTYLRMSSRTST